MKHVCGFSGESVAGTSCAVEHCSRQETETGESVGECHTKGLVIAEQSENHTIAANASGRPSPVQSIRCDVEKQMQSCKTPVSGSEGLLAELAPTSLHGCECSDDPAENKEVDCRSSATEVDFIAVIKNSEEMEDQMMIVGVNPNNLQSSR